MPNCNIIGCGVKRRKNRPNITLHRLPANKRKNKIWLETIGVENVNMSTKNIHICSLHFEESCFNRTLNKVTLRDDALPSRTLLPPIPSNMSGILIENDKNQTDSLTSISGYGAPNKVEDESQPGEILKRSGKDLAASTSGAPGLAASTSSSATPDLSVHTSTIINKLKDKCQKQFKKIKRLNEKIRRQTKKIAHFNDIIKDLKKRNLINSESQALLVECAGSQDFLKRQVAKSKGLPLERQYSEEIRKFALTLNFLCLNK